MPHPGFSSPPHSSLEIAALADFAVSWTRFCDETPDYPESYEELFSDPAWPAFRAAATAALAVKRVQGMSNEEVPESIST